MDIIDWTEFLLKLVFSKKNKISVNKTEKYINANVNDIELSENYEEQIIETQLKLLSGISYLTLPKVYKENRATELVEWIKEEVKLFNSFDLEEYKKKAHAIADIVFEFKGIGPNAFDWYGADIPFQLNDKPVTLYLVKLDFRNDNTSDFDTYKVGITNKPLVKGPQGVAKYSGYEKIWVKVLCQHRYSDGRDAYIRQQKIKNNKLFTREAIKEYNFIPPKEYTKVLEPENWIWQGQAEHEVMEAFKSLINYSDDFSS